MTNAREARDVEMSEAEFMEQIVELAKATGWSVYHVHDSRRSEPGWPDLALVRGATMIFLECKTETGRVTPEQEAYIRRLGQVRYVYANIARPKHWAEIAATLKGARR